MGQKSLRRRTALRFQRGDLRDRRFRYLGVSRPESASAIDGVSRTRRVGQTARRRMPVVMRPVFRMHRRQFATTDGRATCLLPFATRVSNGPEYIDSIEKRRRQ